MEEPPDSLEEAYKTYRPLLFGALARLSGRGVVVGLDEGLDIIHDFLLDEYARLRARFDPVRGRFTTLLYVAFTRYASTRVARLRRWRDALVVDDAARVPDVSPGEDAALDEQTILDCLARLDSADRSLLQAWFDEGLSERALARRNKTSRYAIRDRLVQALGRLANQLGDRGDIPEVEWHVGRALWSEGRGLDDVAAQLGITRERARRAAQRAIARFERALEKGRT